MLDTFIVSLKFRFNSECTSVFKLISFVVQFGDSFDDAVRQLAAVVQLNTDVCVAEGRVVMTNKCYAVPEGAIQSGPSSLQSLTSKIVTLGHSVAYKNFYALLVFLLTLPVTSASCERAHSKVDLVKSAVRASMGSERLEHLVLISSAGRLGL